MNAAVKLESVSKEIYEAMKLRVLRARNVRDQSQIPMMSAGGMLVH